MTKLEEVLYTLDLLFDIKSIDEAKDKLVSLQNDISTLQRLLAEAGELWQPPD